jgi:hypothetical protein
MAVPQLLVEVAFDAPKPYTVNPTWTDITSDVRTISINRGRSDDFDDQFVTNATLELNNQTRKYDPFNDAGPYAGKLTPRRQIRISGIVGSTPYVIFRGFINGFPVRWTDAGYNSTVTIDCFDILSLLSTTTLRTDTADIFTRSLTPKHYYKFSDPDGSTTIKDFGSDPQDLTLTTGSQMKSSMPLGFGLFGKSASLVQSEYGKTRSSTATTGDITVCFWAQFPVSSDGASDRILRIGAASSADHLDFYINKNASGYSKGDAYAEVYRSPSTGYVVSNKANSTNLVAHHYAITYNSTSGALKIFVDGVDTTGATSTRSGALFFPTHDIIVQTGVVQELALFDSILSDANIEQIYKWGAAKQDETTAERFNRFIALTDLEAGSYSVYTTGTSGILGIPDQQTPISDALVQVQRTEGGYVFVSREGVLTAVDRSYIYTNTKSATPQMKFSDDGIEYGYTQDLQFWIDGDNLRNEVVINYGGGIQSSLADQTSIDTYGRHTHTIDTQSSTSDEADELARHWLAFYSSVYASISPIEVGLPSTTTTEWQKLLQLDLLQRISFVRQDMVGTSFQHDMLLNSINFNITPKIWSMKIEGTARFCPPPTATIAAATSVTGTSATLNGTVSANGPSATVNFQYSTDSTFATGVTTVAATQSPVTGQSVAVSKAITGLTGNSTYYARIVATSSAGTTTSANTSFVAGALATASISATTAFNQNSGTLHGTVNANGLSTTVTFELSLSNTFGTIAHTISAGTATGGSPTTFNTSTGTVLSNGTTYYVRVKAVNSFGTTYSSTYDTFTTYALKTVVFTASGSWTMPSLGNGSTPTSTINAFAVGGGGSSDLGGGGGGSVINTTSITLASTMSAAIGAGGTYGNNGGTSTLTNLSNAVGGYKDDPWTRAGSSGNGNLGGTNYLDTLGSYPSCGGGGGGAGGAGADHSGFYDGGAGGASLYVSWRGDYYGGGGGGAGMSSDGASGGGAAGVGGSSTYSGGSGGGSAGQVAFQYYGPTGSRSGTGWSES